MRISGAGLLRLILPGVILALFGVACSERNAGPEAGAEKNEDNHAERIAAAPEPGRKARSPAVAGAFYPGDADSLRESVGKCIEQAEKAVTGKKPVAGVVPHAGYVYSGKCAGSFYRELKGSEYSRVIILGPSHYRALRGIALPSAETGFYRTPLGDVRVDRKTCRELAGQPGFTVVPGAGAREHSIEVQLPFLQATIGEFSLVPLLCGHLPDEDIVGCGEILAEYLDDDTLVLASTDFTHYGPRFGFVPFKTETAKNIRKWLEEASRLVAGLDREGFAGYLDRTKDTICGRIPIRVMLESVVRSGISFRGKVLDRYCSGDITGDYRNSVSYASIAVYRDRVENTERPEKEH